MFRLYSQHFQPTHLILLNFNPRIFLLYSDYPNTITWSFCPGGFPAFDFPLSVDDPTIAYTPHVTRIPFTKTSEVDDGYCKNKNLLQNDGRATMCSTNERKCVHKPVVSSRTLCYYNCAAQRSSC
ncbi:uncharacterized protein An12g08050 [Aspergillus niger]|uniref:Contig An12c0270, genomic contig n=2 Tax=Aspergillus niger TaxID=5061 RepID=A2R0B7_ASPNC|nr:uncharacterized protein An12g08050 [Aspergillus niger]CAK41255.1 unnamed protein product [Aspergillus niger]